QSDGGVLYGQRPSQVAREIAARVERSLPTVEDVEDAIACMSVAGRREQAWMVIDLIRSSLGLNDAAPEREEPGEPEPCIRPAPWNGSQQSSEPAPDGTWATLPAEVRSAVA